MAVDFVGIGGIVISKVDDTIFVTNSQIPENGVPDSFALYADAEGKIKSSGLDLNYDTGTRTLNSFRISAKHLVSTSTDSVVINSERIFSGYLYSTVSNSTFLNSENISARHIFSTSTNLHQIISQNISANDYIISVPDKQLEDDVFAKIGTHTYNNQLRFAVAVKKNSTDYACAISIDQTHRVSLEDGRLNIRRKRVVETSKGSPGDQSGDIAVNKFYLYYCIKDYNGVDSIWVRWKVSDLNW